MGTAQKVDKVTLIGKTIRAQDNLGRKTYTPL